MAKLLSGTRIYGNLVVDTWANAASANISGTTTSNSTTTGALIVAGGAGIAGNLSIGGNVGIGTAPSIYTLDILDTNPNSGTGLRVIGGNVGYPIATFTRQGTNSSIVIQHGSANPGMYYTKTGTTYVSHGYDGTYFKLSNAAQIGTNDLLLVTQANGNIVITSTTASTNTTTGALTVAGGVGIAGNVNIGGNVVITGSITSAVFPLILNDISNQFNANRAVFALRNNQAPITNLVDSKDLSVVVDGRPVSPYITELRYPWLTPYNSFKGFRVAQTAGNLKLTTTSVAQSVVIYNAPDIGQQATITQINTSATKQTRRYPYSASSIALGD
jgi:hypothetical protein